MMLVTKCPNCHTVFKVVSDQLKISEGWVRCGQCNQIFDTTLNVREWDPNKPEDDIPPSIVSHDGGQAWTPSPVPPMEGFATTRPAPSFQAKPESPPARRFPAVEAAAAPLFPPTTPAPTPVPTSATTFEYVPASRTPAPHPSATTPLQRAQRVPIQVSETQVSAPDQDEGDDYPSLGTAGFAAYPSLERPSRAQRGEPRFPPVDDDEGDALPQAPLSGSNDFLVQPSFSIHADERPAAPSSAEFMGEDRPTSFWASPSGRKLMLWGGVVLALVLVIQYSIHQRDRIATYVPSLRPALEGLCQVFGCKVLPLRQIESITVESSSFNRFRGESYRLSFVIRNSSDLELAKPALELTLTDSQDQAVYRRVLLPTEFTARSPTLSRGEEWSESLVISLTDGNNPALAGTSKSVTGYRLLAFYP